MSVDTGQTLLEVLQTSAEPSALDWLTQGLPVPGKPFDRGLFFGFYAGSGRRFRKSEVSEAGKLAMARLEVTGAWTLPDVARALLLVRACGVLPPGEHLPLVEEAYLKGDNGERIGVLRALALLPAPERFVGVGIEACRSHVQDVFDAIACENSYPADYFPEAGFNQLVIKSMFTEVPIGRVAGWRRRNNAELKRIAGDFADERRAAGRSVPEGVGLIQAEPEGAK